MGEDVTKIQIAKQYFDEGAACPDCGGALELWYSVEPGKASPYVVIDHIRHTGNGFERISVTRCYSCRSTVSYDIPASP